MRMGMPAKILNLLIALLLLDGLLLARNGS